MKTKLSGCLALFMVLIVQLSFAQDKTITGTVTDSDGLPLPGATVQVKDMAGGTQTDFDGNYSIEASEGQILLFTYVGFDTTEVTVGASNAYDVSLSPNTTALDEVVVVGYGTATKQSFAGTATTIDLENIETKSYANITQSLAGEVAGVNVINTSGQPGSVSTIRIRGFGSVTGNRDPLYVVDGVPFTGSLNSINPGDIKSTTILKDATATAIYGSRGANGVVLITTKTGSSNESYIEVDVRTGVNQQLIPRYDVVESPEEYIGYVWEGIYNRAALSGNADPVGFANSQLFTDNYVPAGYNMWNVTNGGELIDPQTHMVRDGVTRKYTPKRYADEAFSTGILTDVTAKFAGGNEKTKHFFSLGYISNEGNIINASYKRYTTRLNVNTDVKKWLNVGANIGYAYSESRNNGQTEGAENLFEFSDKMAPIFPVFGRDDEGNLIEDPIYGGYQYDYGGETVAGRNRPNANNVNPIASAMYDFVGNKRHEVNGSFSADFTLTDGLTFETKFGAQYAYRKYTDAQNRFYGTGRNSGGTIFRTDNTYLTLDFLQLLRYQKQFGDHSLEVLAAHQTNEYERTYQNAYKGNTVYPGIYELSNYVVELSQPIGFTEGRTLESYFGQVNYNFNQKYYITGSIRTDGSSKFTQDKWGTFGSIGAAWILSNENFFKVNTIEYLKLKASYGIIGDEAGVPYNQSIPTTYNTGNLNDEISLELNPVGNQNLTWETSRMLQAGLEFSLGTFLDGSIDYYSKKTDNLFFDRRVGPSIGYALVPVNDGEMKNNGLELQLTGHIIDKKDFQLDLSVNGAFQSNEITKMPIDPATGEQQLYNAEVSPYAYQVGKSIYDFYVREYAGVDPANGAPLWNQYYNDIDGDGSYNPNIDESINDMIPYLDQNPDANIQKTITDTYSQATQKYVGKSAQPDLIGGFRLSATYKNFNLSTQFTYSLGGYGYDSQYAELMSDRFGAVGNNYHKDIRNRWQQPGDITDVPALTDNYLTNGTSTSTRFITSTDYFALNNASIGYTFSESLLKNTGIDLVNIYASGDNLMMLTARDGFFPNTSESGTSGRYFYAPMTTISLGLKVKF